MGEFSHWKGEGGLEGGKPQRVIVVAKVPYFSSNMVVGEL